MNKLTDYLGNKAFWRVTLRLALPIAFQNLLISSLTLVDTLMVGQLGDVPLSSVGMAGQWSWLMSLVLFGIGSGTALFISQYWGVNDITGIHRVFGLSTISCLTVSLIFTSLGFFVPEFIISIFNRTPEVITEGASYLRIAAWSFPAVAISQNAGITLRSSENVKLPMYTSAAQTLFNVALNWCLIFGKLGLPAMGVRGAAVATVISSWASVFLLFGVSAVMKNIIIAPIKELFGFTKTQIAEFFKRTSPVIMNETLWGFGTMLFNIMYSNLGYQYYAAVTILKTYENIAFVFFLGLCNACSVMLGKAIGAGKIGRAIGDARRFTVLIPLAGIILGVIIAIFRGNLVALFNLDGKITAETAGYATAILLVYAICVPVRNIPYIQIVGIFRPGGDTTSGVKYDIGCLWLISIPATFICAYIIKLPFPIVYFIMYACEDIIKSALCLRRFFSNKWIRPVTEQGIQGLAEYNQTLKPNK